MINVFLMIYQLGTCCVYVVFISSNIKGVVDLYTAEPVDVRLIMVMILLPLIFLNWVSDGEIGRRVMEVKVFFRLLFHPQIRNLKYLAPFSTFANFITMVSFGLILYYIFETPFTVEDKHAVGEIKNFPLFFGTVLFALEAIGVVSLWVFLLVYWNWGDKTSDVETWLLKIMSILPKLYIKNISKTFKACNMTNDLFCEDIASLCCQDVIFVQPQKLHPKALKKPI